MEELRKNQILQWNDHIVKHFKTEETLMEKYNYSEYADYERQHKNLSELYENMKTDFRNNGVNSNLKAMIKRLAVNWYDIYVADFDIRLGEFLKNI